MCCDLFSLHCFPLILALNDDVQWKQKHQALMLQRDRVENAKALELKAKVDHAKCEAKEHKQSFKEHFDSATSMMRVVASTFAKLAAVENAREKDLRQREIQVCGGGGCYTTA